MMFILLMLKSSLSVSKQLLLKHAWIHQQLGEVGENEGTHHLIEARASLLRSPRQMKKEGAPPQQLRDF